jgi:AraC family transcriptional regulator
MRCRPLFIDPNRIYQGQFGRIVLLEMRTPLVEHAHSQCHLLFKISGSDGAMNVCGRRAPLEDDTVVLINSWEPHSFIGSEDGGSALVLAFYLEPHWLSGLEPARSARLGQHCAYRTPVLRKVVQRLVSHMIYDNLLDRQTLENLVAETVFGAANGRNDASDAHASDFRITRAIRHLRTNSGCPVNVEQLAALSGLSTAHFFERFKACTGLTPCAYANVIRMEAALAALSTQNDTISRISDQLGFCAQSNFTRFFRQHVGISPTTYRRVVQLV